MLRRTAAVRILFFTSGSGSATRLRVQPSEKTPASYSSEELVPVFLPWSARPWEVTHNYHQSQWKFLDTVFSHLATVTPTSLNERAQVQNARDVLSDIDDPVVALRRQQSRQARMLKRQEKAAKLEKAAANAAAPARPNAAETAVGQNRVEDDVLSSLVNATLAPSTTTSSAARNKSREGIAVGGSEGDSDDTALAVSVHAEEAKTGTSVDAASSGGKYGKAMKGAKKRKSSKKMVETIHYL